MVPAISIRSLRRGAHRWQRQVNRRVRTHRRAAKLMGAAACAAIAFAYLAAAWWIVFDIRVGPVVATLTETHGIHSGDMIGVVSMFFGAAFAIGSAMLLESGLGRTNVSLAHRRHR